MRKMNRSFIAVVVGISLAGCAQTKTKLTPDGRPAVPVAITPLPSIYESINHGTGNKVVQQGTLRDRDDPMWAGRAGGPGDRVPASPRAMASSAKSAGNPPARVMPSAGSPEPGAVAAEDLTTGGKGQAPTVAENASKSEIARVADPIAPPAAVATNSEPAEVPGPGGSPNPIISANGLKPVADALANGTDASVTQTATVAAAADPAGPAAREKSASDLAGDPPGPPAEKATSAPAADPLLGPNPVLMPMPSAEDGASSLVRSETGPTPKDATAAPGAPVGDTQPGAASAAASEPDPSKPPIAAASPAAPPSVPDAPVADPLLGPNPVLMPMPGAAELDASLKEKPTEGPADSKPAPATEASPAPTPSPADTPKLPPVQPEPGRESTPPAPAATPETKPEVPITPAPASPPAEGPARPAKPSNEIPEAAQPSEDAAMPIVGTAKDENGQEFPLPLLPEFSVEKDEPAASSSSKSLAAPKPDPAPAKPAEADALPGLPPAQPAAPEAAPSAAESTELPPLPAAEPVTGTTSQNAPAQDPAVQQTSATPTVPPSSSPTEVRTPRMSRDVKEAGRMAARVGDEVITLNDLLSTVREYRKKHPSDQPPSAEEQVMMGQGILMMLIERTLLTQEAKRVLKNPKMLDQLMGFSEQAWTAEELPTLYRKYYASNSYELKEKMAKDNRSLDAIHEAYRQDFLAGAYLQQKVGSRMKVELPEMLKYYQEHVSDPDYQRPAAITWREVVIETAKYPSPQDARLKAGKILERLRKGEDFAKLVKAESDGPGLAKAQGGLMETSPGSYGVAAVNQAIDKLPIGKVSDVLEGPGSLHIVLVEKRRAAGPVSFEEIQGQIGKSLKEEKSQKERVALIQKLRKQTLVWTMFDAPEHASTP